MPEYQVTQWVNEVANGLPLRYRITRPDNSVLVEGAVIELLNVIVPGTPVNATNLNKIEGGVKTAQDSANTATAQASAAQGAANTAQTSAGTAQGAANSAATAAANAQGTANTATGAAATAQSAANLAQVTANTAITSAGTAQSAANAAQGTANSAVIAAAAAEATALARKPVTGYAERTTEWSTASAAFVDVAGLSVTVTVPAAATVMAFFSGTIRADTVYVAAAVKIMIDGVLSNVQAMKSCNSSATDISWVPASLTSRKLNVAAGSRVVKVQMANAGPGGSGNAVLHNGNLFVIVFQE